MAKSKKTSNYLGLFTVKSIQRDTVTVKGVKYGYDPSWQEIYDYKGSSVFHSEIKAHAIKYLRAKTPNSDGSYIFTKE